MKEYILEQLELISNYLGLRNKFAEGFSVRFETEVYDLEKSNKELKEILDGHRTLEVYWEDPENSESTREFICDVYETEKKERANARLYRGLLDKIKNGTLDIKRYMIPYWKEKNQNITKSGFILPQ